MITKRDPNFLRLLPITIVDNEMLSRWENETHWSQSIPCNYLPARNTQKTQLIFVIRCVHTIRISSDKDNATFTSLSKNLFQVISIINDAFVLRPELSC